MAGKIDKKDIELLTEALVRGVQIFGEAVFDRTQRFVPVESGTLKQSGETVPTDKGIILVYHAPYALIREKVVPRRTRQKPPRGTFYVERAIKAELSEISFYMKKALEMSILGRRKKL